LAVPPPSASGSLDLSGLGPGASAPGAATYEPPPSRYDDGYSERRYSPEDTCTRYLKKKQDSLLTCDLQTVGTETRMIDHIPQQVEHPSTTNHIGHHEMNLEVGIVIVIEIERENPDVTETVIMAEGTTDDKVGTGKGLPVLAHDEHTLLYQVIMKTK
jgi:hypothetical protein